MKYAIHKDGAVVGYIDGPEDAARAQATGIGGEYVEVQETGFPHKARVVNGQFTVDQAEYAPPPKTLDEKWTDVRRQRDMLMFGTAWVREKAADLGKPVPQYWLDYWQALRDIPQKFDDPDAVVWPIPPL